VCANVGQKFFSTWRDILLGDAIPGVLLDFVKEWLYPPLNGRFVGFLDSSVERPLAFVELVRSVLARPEWTRLISKALAVLTANAPPLRVWHLQALSSDSSAYWKAKAKRLSRQLQDSSIRRHQGSRPLAVVARQSQGANDRTRTIPQTVSATCGKMTSDAETESHPSVHMRGHGALTIWKNTAGANKSWRRCPKVVIWRHSKHRSRSSRLAEYTTDLFVSRLWIPHIFERHPPSKTTLKPKRLIRVKQARFTPSKHKWTPLGDMHDCNTMLTKRGNDASSKRSPGKYPSKSDVTEPGTAFTRLIWDVERKAKPWRQLDCFVPSGQLFRKRWRVLTFLRNDSHADVYSVHDIMFRSSRRHESIETEAHFFLDDLHGNWLTAAKRKQGRLRSGQGFEDEFSYGIRCVIVVRVLAKAQTFDLRMSEKDFPYLTCKRTAPRAYSMSGGESYASIVRKSAIGASTELQQRVQPHQSIRDAKRSVNARVKRSEKQRMQRLAQRHAQRSG